MNVTIGTRVTTPEGYTGIVTTKPTLTPTGHVVSVQYDAEHAHHSPAGGADYDTDALDLDVAIGTRVTTPEGFTGTVTTEPNLTATGHVVSVEYDAEHAHHSPAGGADYDLDALKAI